MIEQLSLLGKPLVEPPATEGIKYAGSKLKILAPILQLAQKTGAKTVFDGFAGTTRVSQAFAQQGYRVIGNDIALWSRVFGTCYLQNRVQPSAYEELINHLNEQAPIDGWFTQHYGADCQSGNAGLKKPWQIHNTRKLDAIRAEIDRLRLSELEKAVALTSLILALDRVDSTLGHFVSYLREWSPRSYKPLRLEVPRMQLNTQAHEVACADVFSLASRPVDLAYYDPPYGSNNDKRPPSRVRYASYYHLWTTIIRNDQPALFGKAGRRVDTSDRVAASVFEEFRREDVTQRFLAVAAIERLLRTTVAPWVILSYRSGGRATAEELSEVFGEYGRLVEVLELDYKRHVMAAMKWADQWIRDTGKPNREFLFLLEKTS